MHICTFNMNDNSSLAYPAEYYYPEFIYSRPDDPHTSSPLQLPLGTSVDNGKWFISKSSNSCSTNK